jgi:hypothetical protein
MKEKVYGINGDETIWERIKCSSEWEQGCYHFDGTWHVSNLALEKMQPGELDAIILHIYKLVEKFNGIDFYLRFENMKGDILIIKQQLSRSQSMSSPKEYHYTTIMLPEEY